MPIHISNELPDLLVPEEAWRSPANGVNGHSHSGESTIPRVRHLQKSVSLLFDPSLSSNPIPGKGDLYVAESQLVWYSPEKRLSIAIDYPSIGIHAISRQGDALTEGKPHVYGQLDSMVIVREERTDAMDHDGESDGEEQACEFRLVPDDLTAHAMFQAISDCAALHPDPDAEEDDNEEGDWYYTPDDPQELNGLQEAALQHLDSVFEGPNPLGNLGGNANPNDQFADATEDMEQ
ncbi:hypothetical protein SpCBS45565_g06455 [Spizellomyces sp. 'palustris']|nr:hypothetical protein SpCBS45565_g06455 [Spizellomyces sp. 'palustris']